MTKMVQLSNEAYGRLKTAKRQKESFSDVVLRLTAVTGGLPLDGLIGLMTPGERRRADAWQRKIDRMDLADARSKPQE